MENWSGEERRGDNISTRLSLLEKGQADTERRHFENKNSLNAVHKRITEIKKEFADEVKMGFKELIIRMDAKNNECAKCKTDITKLQTTQTWIERWVAAGWVVMASIFGIDRVTK